MGNLYLKDVSSLKNVRINLDRNMSEVPQILELCIGQASPQSSSQMALLHVWRTWREDCLKSLLNAMLHATGTSVAIKTSATTFETEFVLVLSHDDVLKDLSIKQDLLGHFIKSVAGSMKDIQTVMGAFEGCQNNVEAFHILLLGKRQEIEEEITLQEFTQYIDGCPGVMKSIREAIATFISVFKSYHVQLEALGKQLEILDQANDKEIFDEEIRAAIASCTLLRQALAHYHEAMEIDSLD